MIKTTHDTTTVPPAEAFDPLTTAGVVDAIDALEGLLSLAGRVLAQAQAAEIPLRFLGLAPVDNQPRGYPGIDTDWILLPAGRDPLLTTTGRLAMPVEARRQLRACTAIVDFPTMLIAHEVAKGSVTAVPGPFTPEMLCDDPTTRGEHLLAHLPKVAAPTGGASRTATLADSVTDLGGALMVTAAVAGSMSVLAAGGLGLAAVGLAAGVGGALGGAVGGLDPILVGVLPWGGRTAQGTPAALFEITRWVW